MKAALYRPPADDMTLTSPPDLKVRFAQLQGEMIDQLERTAAVENHWLVYLLLGWELLAACVVSHYLLQGETSPHPYHWPFVVLWSVQIFGALATATLVSGNPRIEDSPLQPYIRNLWVIFLLLCCSVAVLTEVTGKPVVVFLPFLATLSSFLFLVLSFLFSRRFVAAALLMFLTGTLMARFPLYGFLLYGAAWLLILQILGVVFLLKRNRWLADLQL